MDRVEHLSQAYSQAPWRKQLQILGLFLMVVIFIALIASIYLNVSARSGALGREIQRKQYEMLQDKQQIANLKGQLGTLYSASEMERRARALGFEPVDAGETFYILVPGYVERLPVSLAPASQPQVVGTADLPAEYTESLFVWLQKQFYQTISPLFKVQP